MRSEMRQQKTTLALVFSLSTQNLFVMKISFRFTSLQSIRNRSFSQFKTTREGRGAYDWKGIYVTRLGGGI